MNSENDKQEHESKHFVRECSETIGLADSVQVETTHIAWAKDWRKLIFIAILTITVPIVTSFAITGWIGMVVGIIIGIGLFLLGLLAVTKTITKRILR